MLSERTMAALRPAGDFDRSYEQDMAGSFSLPAYYSSGIRYYLLLRYRLMKGLDCWIRYSCTLYNGGAETDLMPEPSREIKTQIRWQF